MTGAFSIGHAVVAAVHGMKEGMKRANTFVAVRSMQRSSTRGVDKLLHLRRDLQRKHEDTMMAEQIVVSREVR